jgi:apolipoprotein N-acyltransferase
MRQAKSEASENRNAADSAPRSRRTLVLGLAGALLCYLAHPPAGLSFLAWIGPVPWLLLVRAERLPGRRPYRTLWLAGSVYWLLAIQWIRLPFWANIFGLFLLAAYLGAYLPVFVGLSRVAVHRLRVPLWLAGAIVWTGLELVRAHFLSGFLMASLAHTQVKWPVVIQIADLAGEYAVTFLILLVAGSIAATLPLKWIEETNPSEPGRPRPEQTRRPRPGLPAFLPLLPAALALAAALTYGATRQPTDTSSASNPRLAPRIAIVQSDMLSDWKRIPGRDADVMQQQMELSLRAKRESEKPIDLVVWPETMFRQPWFVRDEKNPPRPMQSDRFESAANDLRIVSEQTGAALLLGIDRALVSYKDNPGDDADYQTLVYNAAVFVDRTGTIRDYYAKMHLLPFGEYIPFAAWIPALAAYAPITGNSWWGEGPVAFESDGVVYSPNICYETVLPHLIRRQVREILARRSGLPDVLVNLTNDSWFWGSSELDMHLASGVFRAVEMRTPLVIAANRGLSAYVDAAGRVVAVTERDRADVLVVDVKLPQRAGLYPSIYALWGDWLPMGCLVCCGCFIMAGWRQPATPRSPPAV